MADVETDGLAQTEQPAAEPKGLDNIIDAAVAKAEAPANESEAQPNQSGDRARDERGRFAAKTAEASTGPSEAAPTDAQQQAQPANEQPLEPHPRWTAEQKAAFAALPRQAQQFLLDRNKEIDAEFTRKSQEIAATRQQIEPLQQALKPYENYFRSINVPPAQAIPALLNAEMMLRNGTPQQKVQLFARLAADYGVDLAQFTGGDPQQPYQQPQVDPFIQQLHQQIAQQGQQLQSVLQHQEQVITQQASSTLSAFESARDDAGQPKYPHYARVRGVMAQAITEAAQRGESLTLEQAYAKAVEPIEAAIADALKAKEAAFEKQRAESVAKAKAAAPVKASGSVPNGSTKAKGLDAILEGAMSQAGF